jgi:hypothetical protein
MVLSIAIAAIILIARAIVPAPNAPGWPLMVLIAIVCGFSLCVGMPALTSLAPSEIVVSPKGINRNGINGVFFTIEFWDWGRICSCCVERLTLNDRSFRVLVLRDIAEAPIATIAFDSQPPLKELDLFLVEQGKKLDSSFRQ